MSLDETIRVRVDKTLKDSLQAIADSEQRSLSNLAKKVLMDYAANAKASALNETPINYPRATQRKRVLHSKEKN